MNCNDLRQAAPQFLDGVLPEPERQRVAAHLDACAACQAALEGMLGEPMLKPHAAYFRAPAALRERVEQALHAAPQARDASSARRPRLKLPEWLKLGMVSFATAVIMAAVLLPLRVTVADEATADALIASHVRWNRLDKLIDVATSDRHTVKPWLSQKLGFSPLVPELKDAGFPLLGGRIDYVEDRFVGTVVYKRRQHVIDVYVWPGSRGAAETATMSHNGYHLVKWTLDDMTYWAVSDLNLDELKQFAHLYAHAS